MIKYIHSELRNGSENIGLGSLNGQIACPDVFYVFLIIYFCIISESLSKPPSLKVVGCSYKKSTLLKEQIALSVCIYVCLSVCLSVNVRWLAETTSRTGRSFSPC